MHERALLATPRSRPNWSCKRVGLQATSATFRLNRRRRSRDHPIRPWNREAGPDFRDAAISLNGSDPIRGSIELDLIDRNWETHGHATNPAFEETVSPRIRGEEAIVISSAHEIESHVSKCASILRFPGGIPCNLPLARPGRCQAPLKDLPEERTAVCWGCVAISTQRKATHSNETDSHGRDEALFQESATALGYKQNKLAIHADRATAVVEIAAPKTSKTPKRYCSVWPVFSRRLISVSTRARRAITSEPCGTDGGRIGTKWRE